MVDTKPGQPPHPGRRVNLERVAAEAGVSLATASRVLNGSPRVNESNRSRVLAAAELLGYRLNLAAHATARGTVPIVAVVVDDLRSPFSAEIAKGVIDAAPGWGLVATVTGGASNPGGLDAIVHGLRAQRPRAIIMGATAMQSRAEGSALVSELEAYEAGGGRVVVVNGSKLPFSSCDLDEEGAARRFATDLVAHGCRRPLVIAGPADRPDLQARAIGLIDGFERSGTSARVDEAAADRAGGVGAVESLSDGDLELLDLIACVDDTQALGVMNVLRRRSIDIGGSLSVTGFGDLPGSTDVRPMLTTVAIPYAQLGRTLLALALDTPELTHRSLELTTRVRDSARAGRRIDGHAPTLALPEAARPPEPPRADVISAEAESGSKPRVPGRPHSTHASARTVTIADVAALAGVSTASVSRVLNNVPTVHQDVSTRVRDAVKRLGYTPNSAARSLSRGSTNTIGVIVPDLSNPMFQELLLGVNFAASTAGYRVQITDTQEHANREARAILDAREHADAVIVCAPRLGISELLGAIERASPCVVINGDVPDDVPQVRVDYAAGIRQLAAHLWDLGHRHIAFLNGPQGSYSQRQRALALREFEDEHPDTRIDRVLCGSTADEGHRAWDDIRLTGATAVVAFNDMVALGLLGRLHDDRIRVPEDLSVAGFDNIPLSRFSNPPLTTVAVPYDSVGRAAWRALNLDGDNERYAAFVPQLILRQSTGVPSKIHAGGAR